MKVMRCLLKLAAAALAVYGALCLVRTYRDTLEDIFYTVVGKIKEKKARCADLFPLEFEDFADGELE